MLATLTKLLSRTLDIKRKLKPDKAVSFVGDMGTFTARKRIVNYIN